MKCKCIGFLFSSILVAAQGAFGQNDPEAVIPKKSTNIDIQLENGGLKIVEHNFLEKIFYRNFEKHSHESIFYSDFDPIINLEAKTLIPDKARFKTIKVSNIETKDIVQSGIFYGGYKRKSFVYPALAAGAVGKLEYSKVLNDAHLLSPFYFNDEDVMVNEAEFIITMPMDVVIDYKIFGSSENEIEYKKEIVGNTLKYTWKLKNVKPFHKDDDAPGRSFSSPHVIFFIKSFKNRGQQKNVLSDASDLYGWCFQMLKLMPVNDNTLLTTAVSSIIKKSDSDSKKIESIFQWVQSNISYIAFEDGMAGFVPRAASDVYMKRYGDCKDMANLLKCMINTAGIEANLAWIGTRSKPYSYYEIPCPIVSNHMICMVRINNEPVFLDATNSYSEFGKPSSMIQGKEALVGVSDGKFDIIKVPVIAGDQNLRMDSVYVSVLNQDLKGSLTSLFRGYRKEGLEFKKLKDQIDKENDFLEDFLNIGNNNISLEHTMIKGLGIQNEPAVITLNFTLPGYQKKIGDKLYINLNLNKSLPGERVDIDERRQLIEMEYKYKDRSVIVFTIPENYVLSFVPDNSVKKWDHFGLTATYHQKGNQVILEKNFYSDALYLDRSKFKQWNEMIDFMTEINQQSIIVSKIIKK